MILNETLEHFLITLAFRRSKILHWSNFNPYHGNIRDDIITMKSSWQHLVDWNLLWHLYFQILELMSHVWLHGSICPFKTKPEHLQSSVEDVTFYLTSIFNLKMNILQYSYLVVEFNFSQTPKGPRKPFSISPFSTSRNPFTTGRIWTCTIFQEHLGAPFGFKLQKKNTVWEPGRPFLSNICFNPSLSSLEPSKEQPSKGSGGVFLLLVHSAGKRAMGCRMRLPKFFFVCAFWTRRTWTGDTRCRNIWNYGCYEAV